MRRCQWCKNGIPTVDAAGAAYVECALIPPTPITVQQVNKTEGLIETELAWVRPPMALLGWCGQFSLSVRKLLFSRGPRT